MSVPPPPLAYRLALAVLTPALVLYTLWLAIRSQSWRYLLQRLGFHYPCLCRPLWVHCASVGEFNTVVPLLVLLRQRHPDTPILVSGNTTTGATLFERCGLEGLSHSYLPLDMPGAVARFLHALQPRAAIVLETELWPNLFAAARRADIPLIIANARLSSRAQKSPHCLRSVYRYCLNNVDAVLAKSDADAERYIQLGADRQATAVIGNLKFAPRVERSSAVINLIQRPYVLATSTHCNEERQLAHAWRRTEHTGLLLVVAPRHPQRGATIARQLRALGLRVARRSLGDAILEETDIYLADTLGEIQQLIAHARWVFVGGSLVARGGHNLLEPARARKAILCGPHMENFSEEIRAMVAAGGAVQLNRAESLGAEMDRLNKDARACHLLGMAAARLCARNADITTRYADAIENRLWSVMPRVAGLAPTAPEN